MNDPCHEEHENGVAWIGGRFCCERFDRQEVNEELVKYFRWYRDRYGYGFEAF